MTVVITNEKYWTETAAMREFLADPANYDAMRAIVLARAPRWQDNFDLFLAMAYNGSCRDDSLNCQRCELRFAIDEVSMRKALSA